MKISALNRVIVATLAALLLVSPCLITTAGAAEGGLVDSLVSSLGVTKEQAAGGAGALLDLAKKQLSAEDFSKVKEAIPDAGALVDAVPKGGDMSKALGDASSMLGGAGGSLEGLAGLAGTFSQLGLNADMVGKFVPVLLDFAQGAGGDSVMNLLQGVLK
jgi:hypothetical protein